MSTQEQRTPYLVVAYGKTKAVLAQCWGETMGLAREHFKSSHLIDFGEPTGTIALKVKAFEYGYTETGTPIDIHGSIMEALEKVIEVGLEELSEEVYYEAIAAKDYYLKELSDDLTAALEAQLPASLPELMMHVLNRLANGENFNVVVEATGITARVSETIQAMRNAAQEGTVNRLIQDLQALSLQGFGENEAQVLQYAGGNDEPANLVPTKPDYDGGPVMMQTTFVR